MFHFLLGVNNMVYATLVAIKGLAKLAGFFDRELYYTPRSDLLPNMFPQLFAQMFQSIIFFQALGLVQVSCQVEFTIITC